VRRVCGLFIWRSPISNFIYFGKSNVRIPLGYWSVPITSKDTKYSTDPSPFIQGAWPYLLQSLQWARDNHIYVIIDLHGAPGSQNGFDNSGQRTANPQWATNADNIGRTIDIIQFVARQTSGLISILEFLNEPAGFIGSQFDAVLQQYWRDSYQTVRQAMGNTLHVMIGDAFLGLNVPCLTCAPIICLLTFICSIGLAF
jgi:glucan 1,3-beta-glucosidase